MEDREGRSFSVEQAASIMGCHPCTVYELLAEGRLKAPGGRPKKGGKAEVSEKSLFQFIFLDRARRFPARALSGVTCGGKKVGKKFSETAKANRFFTNEGTRREKERGEFRGKQNGHETRCLHHDFAEQHQFSFRWRAWQLAPNDAAMQDDLVQEMSLAVLEYDKPADFDFLFELATNRAKDYLKYEASRGMLSLDAARYARDPHAEETASLERLIENLMASGVPAAWIEEALGGRLEVA
jgi:DNA-directed RNA polymerase specialized sigma24 family protein